MGGITSQPQTPTNEFQIHVKLNSEETVERLERVRTLALKPADRYQCACSRCLCSILRIAATGLDLERQLLRINNELHVTVRLLLRGKVAPRAYLAQQVLALEQLAPLLKKHLEELRASYRASRLPSEDCERETKRLAGYVLERAEGLRLMRCRLIADVYPELRPKRPEIRDRRRGCPWQWMKRSMGLKKSHEAVELPWPARGREPESRLVFFPPFRASPCPAGSRWWSTVGNQPPDFLPPRTQSATRQSLLARSWQRSSRRCSRKSQA